MRKVLYSAGFGAGWTTWHHGPREQKLFMLHHPGIIAWVEGGKKEPTDSVEEAFLADFRRAFPGAEEPYMGGLGDDMCVGEVPDGRRVRVNEYDGYESLTIEGSDAEDWL